MDTVKRWLTDPVESTLGQMPRALVASVLSFALNFSLVLVLVEFAGMHPVIAEVFGYLAGGLLQYVLCLVWVFPATPGSHASGYLAFLILSLIGLPITSGAMIACDRLSCPYPIAVFLSQVLTFGWNFLSRKWILFRSAQLTTN